MLSRSGMNQDRANPNPAAFGGLPGPAVFFCLTEYVRHGFPVFFGLFPGMAFIGSHVGLKSQAAVEFDGSVALGLGG